MESGKEGGRNVLGEKKSIHYKKLENTRVPKSPKLPKIPLYKECTIKILMYFISHFFYTYVLVDISL